MENIEEDNECGKIREFIKQNQARMTEGSDKLKQMIEEFYNMKCRLMEHVKKM